MTLINVMTKRLSVGMKREREREFDFVISDPYLRVSIDTLVHTHEQRNNGIVRNWYKKYCETKGKN